MDRLKTVPHTQVCAHQLVVLAHNEYTHCVHTLRIHNVILVVTPHCGYSLSIPIENTHLGTCPLPFLPCSETTQRNRTQPKTLLVVAKPATFLLKKGI